MAPPARDGLVPEGGHHPSIVGEVSIGCFRHVDVGHGSLPVPVDDRANVRENSAARHRAEYSSAYSSLIRRGSTGPPARSRASHATISVRRAKPNLVSTCWTWLAAVRSDSTRRSALSR